MAGSSIHITDFRTQIPGELAEDVWTFPAITSRNVHGRETTWTICVRLFRTPGEFIRIEDAYFDSGCAMPGILAWINVDSGIVGGKVKKSAPTVVRSGKNLGKISATNVFTQALRDAYGLYNKQFKKAASVDKGAGKGADRTLYPPMLAQVLKGQKLAIDAAHHAFVQRKYNGVRTVATLGADGRVIMYSRRKHLYPGFGHIKAELRDALGVYWEDGRELYLDGEVYSHGVALQDISGYARREEQPIKLHYMIYDCFVANEGLLYSARRLLLGDLFGNFELEYCRPVETFEVASMGEVDDLYKQFLSEGYEGAMVRLDAPYRYSYNEYHSKVLLKMKPTLDAEYEIIDWETGVKGKAAGALMMVCQTAAGTRFPVTPAMELPDRIALAKKMAEVEPNGQTHFANHWRGRPLIVYYDEQSKDSVPQRARTKMEIRLPE